MTSSTSHAPWQVGPVSPTSRIAAAALAALAADSVFVWQATPHALESLALTSIPLLVGIRLIRGFPRSVELAALTFGSAMLAALGALAGMGKVYGPRVADALTVAVVLCAAGLSAVALDWRKSRRIPVVEVARTAPILARRGAPRRYR